jgi:hypothetical protein
MVEPKKFVRKPHKAEAFELGDDKASYDAAVVWMDERGAEYERTGDIGLVVETFRGKRRADPADWLVFELGMPDDAPATYAWDVAGVEQFKLEYQLEAEGGPDDPAAPSR